MNQTSMFIEELNEKLQSFLSERHGLMGNIETKINSLLKRPAENREELLNAHGKKSIAILKRDIAKSDPILSKQISKDINEEQEKIKVNFYLGGFKGADDLVSNIYKKHLSVLNDLSSKILNMIMESVKKRLRETEEIGEIDTLIDEFYMSEVSKMVETAFQNAILEIKKEKMPLLEEQAKLAISLLKEEKYELKEKQALILGQIEQYQVHEQSLTSSFTDYYDNIQKKN